MKSKVKSRRSPRVAHAREVHINGVNGLDSLRRKAEFYDQLALACDLQVGHVVRGLGHNLLPMTLKETQEYLKLHPSTIRGSGGIESPEEILDTLRPGSLEDIFRSGSLEIPEKAVDELVGLMRSRPRSLDIMLEKPSRPSQPLKESPEEPVERLRKAWPLTIEDAGLEQLRRPGTTIKVGDLGAVQVLKSESRTSKSPPSTLDAIAAYLTRMEDGGAAEGYLKVRARKLRFFARQYPELPTSPEPIRTYLRQFKTNDVPTRQDQWKALKALYKFASDEYDLPNPMLNKVDKPRFRKKPGQRLSRDQAKLLLAAIETDLEWALVTCYFGLRFRRIEAERLWPRHIKDDYLVVQGKERTEELPLLPLFRDRLLKLQDNHCPGGRLFPIQGDAMAYHIRRIFKRAGISGVRASPHTLRNTAGALWSTFGGDWTSNRQLLRHSEKTMTDHYSPLTIDELRVKDERHNPMLNLMRELGQAPGAAYTNTSSVRVTSADPTQQLPELLDQMIALGEAAKELKHQLGGNGHRPEHLEEITRYLAQARK